MVDIVDKATRSRMMANIKGRNTKPEIELRRLLHAAGFRFRTYRNDLPGRPDIILPRYRAAIFVHGCFWHRHRGCRYCTTPANNAEFWAAKFKNNVVRDAANEKLLTETGWRVAVVWECSLKRDPEAVLASLQEWLTSPLSPLDRVELEPPRDCRRLQLPNRMEP